jgi:RNA polymerase sigma-70 factor (ECF subfamily)
MTAKLKEVVPMTELDPSVRRRVRGAELFVTERVTGGHSDGMRAGSAWPEVGPESTAEAGRALTLAEVYEAHFDFVWRSARRLGIASLHLDDVVQEVFLVVFRRLAEFEGRSSLKTWLFAITRRIVRDHRRSARRRPAEPLGAIEPADLGPSADMQLARDEESRLLHAVLDQLDEDKREVFVLAELEQMSGPEIAEALDVNLNTVYARLRAARAAFEQAVVRHQARARRGA